MKKLLALGIMTSLCLANAAEKQWNIKHKFLALDESQRQLIYTDEFKPENNWEIKLAARDMQLIGNNQLLLNHKEGYSIFNLETKKRKNIKISYEAKGQVFSVRMAPDGKKYLGQNEKGKGVSITTIDKDDKFLSIARLGKSNKDRKFRSIRRTANNWN